MQLGEEDLLPGGTAPAVRGHLAAVLPDGEVDDLDRAADQGGVDGQADPLLEHLQERGHPLLVVVAVDRDQLTEPVKLPGRRWWPRPGCATAPRAR
jgi:hypothetical protein